MLKLALSQKTKDARTRLPGRRTRVRRGGTWRRGRDAADRASVPRRAASRHVADPDSGRRGPTRPKSGPTRPKSGRLGRNRADSVRIGRIGHIGRRPISAETAGIGRNKPKSAETGRENRRRGRNSGLRCVSCLILSLFCESSILMCFLRIF